MLFWIDETVGFMLITIQSQDLSMRHRCTLVSDFAAEAGIYRYDALWWVYLLRTLYACVRILLHSPHSLSWDLRSGGLALACEICVCVCVPFLRLFAIYALYAFCCSAHQSQSTLSYDFELWRGVCSWRPKSWDFFLFFS